MPRTTAPRLGAARGRSSAARRPLAHLLRAIVEAHRDAREAEAMYCDLSRLCDRGLQQRGIGRGDVLRRVFDRLTGRA